MRYARWVDLLDDLHAGLADGSYARRLMAWASPALLIIDDVGLGQVKKRGDESTSTGPATDSTLPPSAPANATTKVFPRREVMSRRPASPPTSPPPTRVTSRS